MLNVLNSNDVTSKSRVYCYTWEDGTSLRRLWNQLGPSPLHHCYFHHLVCSSHRNRSSGASLSGAELRSSPLPFDSLARGRTGLPSKTGRLSASVVIAGASPSDATFRVGGLGVKTKLVVVVAVGEGFSPCQAVNDRTDVILLTRSRSRTGARCPNLCRAASTSGLLLLILLIEAIAAIELVLVPFLRGESTGPGDGEEEPSSRCG